MKIAAKSPYNEQVVGEDHSVGSVESGDYTGNMEMKKLADKGKTRSELLKLKFGRMKDRYTTKMRLEKDKKALILETNISEANSIWIGNLDYKVTEEEIKKHFMFYGEVKEVTIVTDHDTGLPKGFGYVEFFNSEVATSSLEMDETFLCGRQIRVARRGSYTLMASGHFTGTKLPNWYLCGNASRRMNTLPYAVYKGVRVPRTFALKGGLTPRRFYTLIN